MQKSIILYLLLTISAVKLTAQESINLNELGDLAYAYAAENIDSCFIIADSIANVAKDQNNEYWNAKSDFYLAVCQSKSENFNEAQSLMEKYKTYCVDNDNKNDLAYSLFHLTYIYRGLEKPAQELASINEAIGLFDDSTNEKMQAKARVAKATFMRVKRDFNMSHQLLDEAMTKYKNQKDSIGIAETYNEKGLIAATNGDMKTALELFTKQSEIQRQSNNLTGLSRSLGNIGFANLRLNEIETGEKYIREAYEMRLKLKNPERISMSLIQLAEVHVLKKEWPQALDYSKQALTMSEEHEIEFNISQCYRQISYIFEKMGKHENALKYYKDYENLKDKLLTEKIAKNAQRIEAAYQTADKEKQIFRLESEDKLNQARITQQRVMIGGSMAILGLLSFMFFRVRSKNKLISEQNNVISKSLGEKEILLKEIHHRVKNNLQVISSLLSMQSRSIKDVKAKEAILEGKTRVHSMSLIHQNLYQKDNLTGIEMQDYLLKLSNNLFNTYSLDQDAISVKTDIQSIKLDVETVIPIGLIVNELITNSLKYAFPEGNKGTITVSLKESQGQLVLIVSDDGIGLTEAVLTKKQDSFGHSLIRAFRKKLDAELSIRNQDGTVVELIIKDYKKVA